ncbi:helix-turn-helix transcriptional regulator [Paenibacillus planticolens]|uniref:Helix-turn-helix domain-containing protein n=1 Tax=Paenibacillus planticolens TaxID=2654976 RepID=A0ABX1ZMQ7_9BACL|nr:helix-turn-helix transcriptional regulator [Paenibacillus planticolens]NOV01374.1 helix-turn-helix domain-containing protein [Paenibacillus planticolens]
MAVKTPTNKRFYFSTCRKKVGTQAKVASENNISTVYLRMIENGTFTPGRDLMFKLSKYFCEPVEKLFPDYFETGKAAVCQKR